MPSDGESGKGSGLRALRWLRLLVPPIIYRIKLPALRYGSDDVSRRPIGGTLRYTLDSDTWSEATARAANADLVREVLDAASVSARYLGRDGVDTFECFVSDRQRVLIQLTEAAWRTPIYVSDSSNRTGHRPVTDVSFSELESWSEILVFRYYWNTASATRSGSDVATIVKWSASPVIPDEVVSVSRIDSVEVLRRDLEIVLSALESRSIEYFAVEHGWGRNPVIGIPVTSLTTFVETLQAQAIEAANPVALRLPDATVAIQDIDPNEASLREAPFTVFIPFRSDPHGRDYGHEYGCVIESWSESPDGWLANESSASMQRRAFSPEERSQGTEVVILGEAARSLRAFTDPDFFDDAYPIDAVYLWVDGDDPDWRERRAMRAEQVGWGAVSEAAMEFRYRQFEELKYSLRSLDRFAPWVGTVYVVTDQQRPDWLRETERLKVVDHSEILPSDALPTFNSHSLAAALHRIPGLAERFLYLNDDMFFGMPIRPERFFHSNGVARFFLSRSLMSHDPDVAHEEARLRTGKLVGSQVGVTPTRLLRHAPYALNRTYMEKLEERYADEWWATTHSPFRSPSDIVPEYLHHHLGYFEGLATPGTIRYGYFEMGSPVGEAALSDYLADRPREVFCINDSGSTGESIIESFLESEFPIRSSFEKHR